MWAPLTAEEKLKTLAECPKCDFLGKSGCQYENLMGRPLPCKSGRDCHFNPQQPARNKSGDPIEIIEKEIKKMPAKIEIDDALTLDLYKQGKTDAEISAYLNCSTNTIARWRAKNGLSGRSGKAPSERKKRTKPPEAQKSENHPSIESSPLANTSAPQPTHSSDSIPEQIANMLTELFHEYPRAEICIDGLPIKSVMVLMEYDLLGNHKVPQINLLSE